MHGSSDDIGHPAPAGHEPTTPLAQTPLPTASAQVSALFRAARLAAPGALAAPLQELDDLVADLEVGGDASALLDALHARAVVLHRSGATIERCLDAAESLRAAAQARHLPAWVALGHALRGLIRVEEGLAGAALADLAEADRHVQDLLAPGPDQVEPEQDGAREEARDAARADDRPTGRPGERPARAGDRPQDSDVDRPRFLLLDTLARAFARLRLTDRAALLRQEAADRSEGQRPDDVAEFRAAWAADLAVHALEPLAMATGEPDAVLLGRAEQVGSVLSRMPADIVGERLGRGQDAVRALAAAYRGQPTQALRLLGRNAFGEARDLPPLHRQIATLAAMKSHVLVGSLASARSLDEAASSTPSPTVHVILDICRARERVWLEAHAGGDVQPVLHRLTTLLVRLSWQGLDLVGDTVRQALEQYATREESRTDALTGVGNRRALDEELRHLLRFGTLPLGLVLIDVDRFKAVNDAFTHVVGDEVLRNVATALSGQLRTGDRLLRYGGDEFVVLLPETGDAEAKQVARRMVEAVDALVWPQRGLTVSITTGCAALWSLSGRRPDADAERLFRRADEALLEAKRLRPDADARAAEQPVEPPVEPPAPTTPSAPAAATAPPSLPATPGPSPTPLLLPEPTAGHRAPRPQETTDWTLTPSHGTQPVPVVGPLPAPAHRGEPTPSRPAGGTPPTPTPGSGLRRRQRHAFEEEGIRTTYVAGRREPEPDDVLGVRARQEQPAAAETRPSEAGASELDMPTTTPAGLPPRTLIDLRDSPRRRERLRARPVADDEDGFLGGRRHHDG